MAPPEWWGQQRSCEQLLVLGNTLCMVGWKQGVGSAEAVVALDSFSFCIVLDRSGHLCVGREFGSGQALRDTFQMTFDCPRMWIGPLCDPQLEEGNDQIPPQDQSSSGQCLALLSTSTARIDAWDIEAGLAWVGGMENVAKCGYWGERSFRTACRSPQWFVCLFLFFLGFCLPRWLFHRSINQAAVPGFKNKN